MSPAVGNLVRGSMHLLLAIHDDRFVAALKQMVKRPVPPNAALGVGCLQPSHPRHKVRFGRLDQQVIVHPRVDTLGYFRRSLRDSQLAPFSDPESWWH